MTPLTANVTITWNPQGSPQGTQPTVNPTTWSRAPGTRLGAQGALPTPSWIGPTRTFRGWNSTCGRYARGVEVNANTTVPNNNVRYYARWLESSYRHRGDWYRSSTVTLRQHNLGTAARQALETAMSSWNNSATPITIRFDDRSTNVATTMSWGQEDRRWLGSFRRHSWSGTELRQFEVRIYTSRVSEVVRENPGYTFHNLASSVWSHELGHAVGLDDNPIRTNANSSLMNGNRDRNAVRIPQPLDRQSVNWLYR